ncbi:MAG TPA: asparagine synthase (glutamine-hydrolyzing) [Terriglobia bacterium]|jgi:asparagine synthase (glutamine-hydrolysing)|nr:asparagine synthase (glutamine-hydrolyzing) [Terriglobia bacterium]
MCGICGVFNFGTREPADKFLLKRATDAMVHRGPDDEGFHLDGELGLGNRRLSIIDLPGGHQPISNEDESLWITFNGEIYNYRELRYHLEGRHKFRTATDTEVILHLYEEFGERLLEHLRGMFAFALWDRRKRRLMLARDRIGIKPLYYLVEPGRLAFASELRALRELARQPLEIDPQSVYDFFGFRYVPAPNTFYRNVSKLLPGHYLIADANSIQQERYWDIPGEDETPLAAEEYATQVLETLRESVRLRLVADVPLGVFLSGGVDSTAIVAMMADLGVHPLRTFSVGFEEKEFSELPYARRVAARFSTEHTEVILRPRDLADELSRLVAFRDEPVAEPTDIALYRMSLKAAETVKVVLAGEGSDELFAGYPKYAADRLAGLVSAFPQEVTSTIVRWLPYRQRRVKLALEALSIPDEAERSATWFASFSRQEREALFSPDFLARVDVSHPARVFAKYLEQVRDRPPLKRMLYADLKIWLPDNLLLRGDQMTMAASIEERVPFLDHKLVELAARIPVRLLTQGFRTKVLLRQALSPYLPEETLRRRKVGFTVPVGLWFRKTLNSFVADLLLSPDARSREYFNVANMENFVREHFDGVRDRQKQIWALINFELWRRSRNS